jgi:AcrR family transcriptional regulator
VHLETARVFSQAAIMPRPSASQPPARDRILACASDLFYRKGINHVGINEIIDASGIARMTLYHHFQSKNDVVAAVLEKRMVERRQALQAAMDAAQSPRDKVMAGFGYLRRIVSADEFRGCVFINATVELADPSHPGAVLSAQHKRWMSDRFAQVAREAGWPDPAGFGVQCQLLWDGAVAGAQVDYTADPVDAACQAVDVLITARESAKRQRKAYVKGAR